MTNPFCSPLRLAAATLAGAAILVNVSCEKQETPVVPPPATAAPVTAAGPETPPVTPESAPAPEVSSTPAAAGGAALETFKSEIKSIKAFMEANQGNADAATGLANLRELVKRASAVKTEGLPEDLASAYQGMTSVMQRVQDTLDDLPVPVEQLQEYLGKESAKGETAAQEVMAKVAAFKTSMDMLQKDGEAAAATLKEAGNKYGIDSLDLGTK